MNEQGPPIIVNSVPPQNNWKWQFVTAGRQLLVAVVTSVVILGGLIIGFSGQNAEEVARQEATLNATLALACEFALPVDLDTGRDPDAVRLCFTQYNLEPPKLAP